MIPDFSFLGFSPDQTLERKANLAVERLIDLAPQGAMAVALLEKEPSSYRCAIEIYTTYGPFIARASAATPEQALENVARSLGKKLGEWNEKRGLSSTANILRRMPA